jgi:hypothetical protein
MERTKGRGFLKKQRQKNRDETKGRAVTLSGERTYKGFMGKNWKNNVYIFF